MKAEILNPFIQSTVEVLQTMVGIQPRRGTPRLKDSNHTSYDISGVIGLSGQVQGFVAVSFKEGVALEVVRAFLGETVDGLDEQVRDAVGELANMVAGGAKRALSDAGYDLRIAIPTVVVGHDHLIARPRGVPCFEIPFETEAGPFSVELCVKLEA